ncbi:hypothetical protein ACIBQ1_02010 [Nonomuraea sp. NPDC050153]|uniref:hypothetical protein n=1 Tax=Nonomuraea sp. NPDC050153 TaxID=3364359 RepID=UPI00379039D6
MSTPRSGSEEDRAQRPPDDERPGEFPGERSGDSPDAHPGEFADDPYARTAEPEPGIGEVPAHAAPEDVVLFDQDPDQVQARWRDLQTSFVDDPGESVRRADGLVGEVVDALTSSLTSRTDALRDRWKDAEAAGTEQLRLALRDYRSVLERLLALSGAQAQAQLPTVGKR